MNLLASIWGLIVLVAISLFVKKKRATSFWNMNRVRLVVIVNGIVLSLTVAELNIAKEKFTGTGFVLFADTISTIAYVSLSLLCCLILYFRDQDEHKAGLLEMEKKYYQMLLQKEEDTRRFRHDLTNHLMCLKNIAGKDDLDGVKKYLVQMSGQIEQISRRTYTTGNELIDMILNDKFSVFGDRIKVQIIGKFVSVPDMTEMDLCIIFSNIFQNAAEELSRQEQGWFQMQISTGKLFTEIAVKNSVSELIVLTRSGFPKTRKGDTRNHGLGLQNVKDTVEKNHGLFQITSDEKCFEVKIQLKNLPITNLNDR
jgi:sensor histidine kinase regulating citrate/malate metabolism